jgi:filamentous hemagglutinin family protein
MNKIQFLLSSLFLYSFIINHLPVNSQITPDNTLGNESSQINSNVLIKGSNADQINGGATRGSNLFHSFSEFNIKDGQRVYFANPSGVFNILTRVTGKDASSIFGTLGVDGNANLFLMNPNGILFGKNASLDVQGSFVGTTANGLKFGNQGVFSATNPEAPALLTVNPNALVFSQQQSSAVISNQSQASVGKDPAGIDALGLRVPDGKSLLLVGGNVNLDGGRLNAFGGRVELGGLTEPGNVDLLFNGDSLSLKFPDNLTRADVSLNNQSSVYVSGAGGGDIAVNARNIEILKGSIMYAGILPGLGIPETVAGDITLNGAGEIKIDGSFTEIVNDVFKNAKGQGGNIRINSGSLSLTNGGQIEVITFGQGNAGSAIINASKYVSLDAGSNFRSVSGIFNDVEETGVGNAGGININTDSLFVTNGAAITSSTYNKGNAGEIIINANNISFKGIGISGNRKISSGAFSNVQRDAEGNGGKIHITTDSLLIADGAELDVGVFGQGNGGNVVIDARGTVIFDKGNIFSNIEEKNSVGRGGDVYITSENISFVNGAEIQTSTNGKGDAGNVTITARNKISFDGFGTSEFEEGRFPSGIFSAVNDNAEGRGGDIRLDAELLSITNSAQLTTSTFGLGDAGDFTINARNAILIQGFGNSEFGSSLFTIVGKIAKGKGGNIEIYTGSLSLKEGSQLVALTRGQGDAGNIRINAKDVVTVSGTNQEMGFPSALITSTSSSSTGIGGNITIDTNIFRISDGALFDTRTRNDRTGGDIKVNTNIFEALNGGQFTTTTSSNGSAGKIKVNAIDKVIISGSDPNFSDRIARFPDRFKNLSANSGFFVSSTGSGSTGDIEVNSPKITLDNQGKLNAESTFGNGGNINLNSNVLLLRRGGQISTTAGTAQSGGDGGNINLNTKFIVAVPKENSDILANAFTGKGGNINIQTQGIFGIEPRPKPTDKSDITASSERGVQGQVSIQKPDIDPNRGLIQLPEGLKDQSNQINQLCGRGRVPLGRFVVVGKNGSIQSNPVVNPMQGEIDFTPLATLDESNSSNRVNQIPDSLMVQNPPQNRIVEAQAIVKGADGTLYLVAEAPNVKPYSRSAVSACANIGVK